jgi:hypothetical protein
MMNMIELQDKLKNFSQDQLVSMMQQPTGEAPQFMVLSEITRRQKMQKEAESQQAPTQSVAQEAVAAAGVPQGGIADMARSLAPQTNVAQNTGVNPAAPPQGMPMPSAPQGPAPMAAAPQGIARMASGGVIKMQAAGKIDYARYRELARRLVRGDNSFSSEELKEIEQIKDTPAWNEALSLEARLANSESLSDINPALPRVESSAPTPVFDATVEVPSLNQAPAADAAIYGGGYDPRTNVPSAPSGLAALSQETMPTVDGPFAYPASRFSTNLGPRAMLDWEEGQAEEAALIDARTNADLGSGRTPRYDTAIGPNPRGFGDSTGQSAADDFASYLQNTAGMGDTFERYGVAPNTTGVRKAMVDGMQEAAYFAKNGSGASNYVIDEQGSMSLSDEAKAAQAAREEAARIVAEQAVDANKESGKGFQGGPFMLDETKVIDFLGPEKEGTAVDLRGVWPTPAFLAPALDYFGAKRVTPEASRDTLPTVDKNTPLEKSDLAAELTGDMKPKPRPEDLFAPTTDNALNGATTGATGSGSGGMSDYETELMKIMKSREKAAESDKWLALAQVGMGLMQGGSGSFLGDVGAAGMKGLETLRTSRDQADTDKLSLLKAREDARIDRARIAASAAKGTAPNATALKSVIEDLDTAMAPLAARAATGKLTRDEEMQLAQLRDQRNYYSTILGGLAGGSYGAFPAQATAAGPKDLSNNPPVERNLLGKTWDAITG